MKDSGEVRQQGISARRRAALAKQRELAAHQRAIELHERAAELQERLGYPDRAPTPASMPSTRDRPT